jgi:hypothetical protein
MTSIRTFAKAIRRHEVCPTGRPVNAFLHLLQPGVNRNCMAISVEMVAYTFGRLWAIGDIKIE